MKQAPTVFIPAAGLGSRIKGTNSSLPKPLLSIGNQPLIGRIMSLYPKGIHFVIGVGYRAEWVKQVALVIAKENSQYVTFFETDSWEKEDKGLTNTILDAKPHIVGDFVFHAVDSIIPRETCLKLIESTENTIVLGVTETLGKYRYPAGEEWVIGSLNRESLQPAYVGVSFIKNTDDFWRRLENSMKTQPEAGETIGINLQSTKVVQLSSQEWLDAGSQEGLIKTRKSFRNPDIVLERTNEAIWNIGQRMYKFHTDTEFIRNRISRAENLYPFVPQVSFVSSNMYSYSRVDGVTLSHAPEESFKKFLEFCKKFWFENSTQADFEKAVFDDFYRVKSLNRIQDYLLIDPEYNPKTINGSLVVDIRKLVNSIPWELLTSIRPVRAHGDLHPDNVIFDSKSEKFTLLDWRQDIGGSTSTTGDLYYELGKIMHGLLVDHETVAKNQYLISRNGLDYFHDIEISAKKKKWMIEFLEFLEENSFDVTRTKLMTGIIFLNIAVLHHNPYNKYLFTLGHDILNVSIGDLQ